MSDNEKNVPKRRFKEFENAEAWEQRKLKQLANFAKGQGYSKNDLTDVGTPIILYGRLYTKYQSIISEVDTFAVPQSGSVYSTGEEVIVPASGETAEDIARASAIVKSGFLLGGDLNIIYPNKDISTVFLALSISNGKQQKELSKRAQGKSVVHLHNSDLENVTISFPCRDEQERIGSVFEHIDNLITLYQRKLEKMKSLKKAYLTEMFPAEGERKPKLRFAGFTDDWEQHKFSDYYKICSGYAFKYQDYTEDGVAIVNGESIQHGKVDSTKFNYLPASFKLEYANFILKEGDIVVGLNRPITDGKLKIARIPNHLDDSLLYQRAGKIQYINDVSADFSFVLLEKEILKHTLKEAVGSDQPFISTSKLERWKMLLPKSSDEQYKIGTYFKNLDNLITLHQHKLEKLQNIKKAYLNEMFI